ncbi:nucleotidyltransferase family protein [Pedobacter fastidiosus]|uniref:Nucleotidyltransferase family protein n=1 Tax=Pedobacter fastidiosus TaxID=2765361 RepID=A0ABR7KNM6_9SPHI|nr:nucleotidyltransferase family protein [Pedobacter fastidiosus]MBC6109372.1 nucleotidyltransferase family protein [Pedobacter fastidiosus]
MEKLITKKEILTQLQNKKQDLLDFGVKEIGLFGSFLTNNANSDSDIDLLVDIKKENKTFKNFMSLNYFLENLFNRKVDLVTKQSLSPFIGPHILKSVEYVAFSS